MSDTLSTTRELVLKDDFWPVRRPADNSYGLLRVLHLVETLEVGGTETQLMHTVLCQQSIHKVTVGRLRAEGTLLESIVAAQLRVVEFREGNQLLLVSLLRGFMRHSMYLPRRLFYGQHEHDLCANFLAMV